MEGLVVVHPCLGSEGQLSAASSRRLTLPTQPSRRTILTAYQAELVGLSADEQDPNAWKEMAVNAVFSLCIQRVSVQATDKVMVTLVIQKQDGSASPT